MKRQLLHTLFVLLGTSATLVAGVASAEAPSREAPKVAPAPSPTLVPIARPKITIPVPNRVTDLRVIGFASNAAKGSLEIKGTGKCRFHADIFERKPGGPQNPSFMKVFSEPTALPVTLGDIGPLPGGSYRAYLVSYDDKFCPIQGPDKNAGGWYVDFTVAGAGAANGNGQSGSGQNGSGGNGVPTPPSGGGGGGAKPATGKIASLQVPGGSFAEDEAQKLLVSGQGGCAMDLAISNKSYGGSYAQTFPVDPQKLDGGATLYNGTHFGTLAEGSYHADVTGKNGCTGTAGIDFKVTPKSSTKKVLGKPTLSFDQQPKSGGVFTVSKDSNIWFKVTVPQSVKDEPYASCCDIELDYINEYGGWQPLPNSPFQDAGFSPRGEAAGGRGQQERVFLQGGHAVAGQGARVQVQDRVRVERLARVQGRPALRACLAASAQLHEPPGRLPPPVSTPPRQ